METVQRLCQLAENHSLFLFGARGTGKTTLLHHCSWLKNALFINLLEAKTENRFARDPDELIAIVKALPATTTYIVIDEIQKIPKLLDVVHHLIELTNKHFILTGSSARRLKHGGANLLAGRAFVYALHPFSYIEIEPRFELDQALRFGMLPKLFQLATEQEKILFLAAYTNTYLKEEIWAERFVRNLEPFRHFLEVAAQSNGTIINFSNIARDIGISDYLVSEYYSILQDTLLGFFLQPFHHSFRKRLKKAAKFYFFDCGVTRSLRGLLTVPLLQQTSGYGDAFEHFIITQAIYLASYRYSEYKFSYLSTKEEQEIDLVVERPGLPILLIEIKSTDNVEERHLKIIKKLALELGNCEAICLSRDPYPKQYDGVMVYPWQMGLKHFFL